MDTTAGDGTDENALESDAPQRMSHRRQAAFSVLQGIRRHYASIVDLISYVGLGLVLYAGDGLESARCQFRFGLAVCAKIACLLMQEL